MRSRSRRQVDSLMNRLSVATLALMVIGMLSFDSLGIDPNWLMIGVVLLIVWSGIGSYFGLGSE